MHDRSGYDSNQGFPLDLKRTCMVRLGVYQDHNLTADAPGLAYLKACGAKQTSDTPVSVTGSFLEGDLSTITGRGTTGATVRTGNETGTRHGSDGDSKTSGRDSTPSYKTG
jgi:hypothetical protein